jgi:hypothetical protein
VAAGCDTVVSRVVVLVVAGSSTAHEARNVVATAKSNWLRMRSLFIIVN